MKTENSSKWLKKTYPKDTVYIHISLEIELSEGEKVVYLINFCILIVSAFMKAVKHEENVEH